MAFHVFGPASAPALMLLHGAYTTWDRCFDAVVPLLSSQFRVIAYGTSGFDPSEASEYNNARAEAERVSQYIREEMNGELTAMFASSLGCHTATYLALDPRIAIRNTILDGPIHVDTGWLTPVSARLERPTAQFLSSPFAARLLPRLGVVPPGLVDYKHLAYAGASEQSFQNTAWSNVAWLADLRTLPPRPEANVRCWYGSRERRGVRRSIALLTRVFPRMKVRVFEGFGHGELIFHPHLLCGELTTLIKASASDGPSTP